MGMPTEPILDIMRRSMANLAFVEAHAHAAGPYEVTQLINTFLGALAHPFEAMRNNLMSLPMADAAVQGWPSITKERPSDREPDSLGDLLRLLRNSLAHGNIEFLADSAGQINALRIWNVDGRGRRAWGAIITVGDMRQVLGRFVDLIESRHREFGWYVRGAA